MSPGPSPRHVHQLLVSLAYGDAVSNDALAIQSLLQRAGFESSIFAEHVVPRMVELARPLWEYEAVSSPDTVCLYHFSIGSAAGRMIFHSPDRLVTLYHNITPAEYFSGFNHHVAGLCYHGRRELAAYAERSALALGVSEYNRRELEGLGFRRTAVLPMILDLESYTRPPSRVVRRLYGDGRTNVLFVGRVMPNKRLEDVIKAFAVYQKRFDPRSRLILVGDERSLEHYQDRLREMVVDLSVRDVVFPGHVDHADLLGYYSVSQVFLCLSEHEGFCVPLLEAMEFGIPVVAYNAGAVGETLAGAGVLLDDKAPDAVASVLDRLRTEDSFRRSVLASQARRMEDVRGTDYGALLLERLRPVLEPARP